MSARVLVIEDEPEMLLVLCDNLELEGYDVKAAETGEEGLRMAMEQRPDLVLLDVKLPRMSGYEVCKMLRKDGMSSPIIMVSARNMELDRVAGLEIGADDYVGKPFGLSELLARVRVQLRRREPHGSQASDFAFGECIVSFAKYCVWRGARELDLSTHEFDLLSYFITHRGDAIPREQILRDVWGYRHDALSRTVDTFVARLRKKVEVDPQSPRHIHTVHGVGYRFLA